MSVADLISLQGGWGHCCPLVCQLSGCHRLFDLSLLNLTVVSCCFAPLTSLGLCTMNQQSERTILEARLILNVYFKTSSVSISFSHEDFAISREHTFVDEIIELPTIASGEVKVSGQLQTNKQWQILAVAVELQVRIRLSNHNPREQIGGREEVSRLMNSDEFSILFAYFLEFGVNEASTIARLESFNNCLKVVLAVGINSVILNLRRSSKATELGVLTVNNRTLAVSISNRHGEALESTWAGATCWQVEDHRALAKLSVAVGEVKHGSSVVDLFSIGAGRGHCEGRVDTWQTGTQGLAGGAGGCRLWGQSDEAPKAVDDISKPRQPCTEIYFIVLQAAWRSLSSSGLPQPSLDCPHILQDGWGLVVPPVDSSATGTAAAKLVAIGASLVAVASLSDGVPASQGSLSLSGILGRPEQLGIGHGGSLSLPAGEVGGSGVGEHGSSVVDLISIGGRWCPLVVLVVSAPTGTGSEVYTPVCVIVDTHPEEVLPIV